MIDYSKFHEYEICDDDGNILIPGEYNKYTYYIDSWHGGPGQLDYITANLHYLNETLKQQDEDFAGDELKAHFAALELALNDRITALNDKVDNLSGTGSGGITDTTDLTTALTALRNEFEEFKRATNSSIDNIDIIYGSKIDNLTEKVNDSATNNASRIDAALEAVNSQINNALNSEETGTLQVLLAQSIELLTQKIETIQTEIDDMDAAYDRKFTNMKLEIMKTVGDELGAAQIRNDEALEDLNFRIDKFSKETEEKLAAASSEFDQKSAELQESMDTGFEALNNKYNLVYEETNNTINNLDDSLNQYRVDINNKFDNLKSFAEESYNELVDKTDAMTSDLNEAIEMTKSEVEDYMDTQLGHEGSEHTVTQEESEDPTSIYYGIPAGTVIVAESTGMFKVVDDTKEELQGKIDDTKNILQGEIDQTRTDVEGKLKEASEELHQKITDTSTELGNQIDEMDRQYTESIGEMGDALSGRIDEAESTLNQKLEDLANRVKDTNANASTVQGILSVAMSGKDSVAEVHTRGNSLQLIAGQNNVETIAPHTSSDIEGGRFYTFILEPEKTYAIATRVKDIAKGNYVTDSIGTSYTGDNNVLITGDGQYPIGYILGDYVTVKDSVIGVVSYNEEILPDSQMVAVIDVTELSNAYISQINMGNGVISLDGKLINITGDTVFNDDAIIKGTMTTGKVEIGDSGVKLDKDGLSIALNNGSTIKYDSTGQHFVDSIGNSFAGIGRFMIGNCYDGKRITFKNPWDVVPNIIMIPMQYTLARAAGTDYEADAMLNCYPTNIDKYGFTPVVYTAITSYNFPLQDGEAGTGVSKTYKNKLDQFKGDQGSYGVLKSQLYFTKTDDISDTFSGMVTRLFRARRYTSLGCGYNIYQKKYPNNRFKLQLRGQNIESIICAINKGYSLSSDLEGMEYVYSLAKKYMDAGKNLFEDLPHTSISYDYGLSLIEFRENGDIYLNPNISDGVLENNYQPVFGNKDSAATIASFPNARYVLFTYPNQGLASSPRIIGNFKDLDSSFSYEKYEAMNFTGFALCDLMKGLRGNGNFTPLKIFKITDGVASHAGEWGENGGKIFNSKTWNTEWHDENCELYVNKYDTVSVVALCRADYENNLDASIILSPTHKFTDYEKGAAEAVGKNYKKNDFDYSNPYGAVGGVTSKFTHNTGFSKIRPKGVISYLKQSLDSTGETVVGERKNSIPYISDDIENYDGGTTMHSLAIPCPNESGLITVGYELSFDNDDKLLADETLTESYIDRSISLRFVDMEARYGDYFSSDNRFMICNRNSENPSTKTLYPKLTFSKYGSDDIFSTLLEATVYEYTYLDEENCYTYVARVDKKSTVIEVEMKPLAVEHANLLCENEADRKSGSAVFIATDASAGEYLSGDPEAELDIKIAEAQRENEALSLEKATVSGELSVLTEQEAALTSNIATLTEENEALSNRISNFDVDYSAIEARLNNLLGVTE